MRPLRSPARTRSAVRALAVTRLVVALPVLASVLLLFSCLPSQPEDQLDLCVVRIDPSEEHLALDGSALTDPEAGRLRKLFPTGIVRSGLSANVARSPGRPVARMLVVVTGPLPPRSSLRKPSAGSVIYVQDGGAWRMDPEDARTMPDSVVISPLANGKIRLRYWEGAPVEFAFLVPNEPRRP